MTIRATRILAALALMTVPGSVAAAAEWELSGSIGAEVRAFSSDSRHSGQLDGGQPSSIFSPELNWSSADGRHRVGVAPYLRLDGRDDERTHFDLREAYWRYVGDDWELLAGLEKVFWGVTESRHLVDVVNQTDAVEDIDGEDKLGQPMIQLGLQRDWGRLDAFLLLGFRERTFPGNEGRFRTPLPVDTGAPLWESSREERRIDAALRWSHFIGDWDVGAHLFHGTGREPRLVPTTELTALRPAYDVINQAGVDVQHTRDAWLFKLEGLVREGQGDTFYAWVGGFEYTFYQVTKSAADVGLLFEILRDGRDRTAPLTVFDDDLFVGARLALNDVQDTQLLAGAILDREHGSIVATIEAERRLGELFKLELEGRFFLDVDERDPLVALDGDDAITLRLSFFL